MIDTTVKDDNAQPNKETIAAMLEAERIATDPNVKGYRNLDELFADLKSYRFRH